MRFGPKAFRVGDRVLFEKNQRVAEEGTRSGRAVRLQVRNGTFGTVVDGVDPAGNVPTREGDVPRAQDDVAGLAETTLQAEAASALVVELDDGRRAVLPRSYVETSISLGYALTVFRSQGITVDHTFGLGGDSLFQEAGYTQLSRGRLSNNLYVAAPENPRWEIGHHADDTAQRDALQSLVRALAQSREQTMAQDNVPEWPAPSPDDLAATYDQHATMARWLCAEAPPDVTDELAAASDRAHHACVAGRDARSAEANVSALVAGQRRHDDWVAAHRDEITTWSRLDGDVQRYEYRLGQAAGYTQPEHVTALLGPFPERVGHVERWQSAAGAIEAYRTRWSINGPAALGPEPADPEQRAHWDKTVAMVGRAGFFTAGDTREGGSERASLATRWSNTHTAYHQRDDNRSVAGAIIPSPASLWSDEPDFDDGLDDGFSL
jgi:hypothetical protein